MNQNDQRVVPRCSFKRPLRQQPLRVASRDDKLRPPLHSNEGKNCNRERVPIGRYRQERPLQPAGAASVTVETVKPGPSAMSNDFWGNAPVSTRSSTNSAVGADILP